MLDVKLLGQFEVLLNGQTLTIPTRNAQSLLAYLILNAGKAQRREKLAGILWPDSSEDNARSNLRHELWRLRKALNSAAEAYFIVDDLSIAFNPHSEYTLDVTKLESAARETQSADHLMESLSAYRGELLPGFFDEWVLLERQRLHTLFEAQVARLLTILQAEARWAEVLEWGMRWISESLWPEPAYRALMTAYANSGDIGKALMTYERFAQGLQAELGTKPSVQTQALYKSIKTGWKVETKRSAQTLTPSTHPEGQPVHIPNLPRQRRSNLPRALTSFIGREKEIQQVGHLVSSSRLVTITGPGGMGKTRLAIQSSEALLPQFPEGVWWVDLVSLSLIPAVSTQDGRQTAPPEGDVVAQAVVKALRIPEAPGLSLVDGLADYLYDKHILLVWDNCEHLIAACAALAERLLVDCPQVSILTTSREPLGVPGEKAWTLPSLSLPEPGPASEFNHIVQAEAVRLFMERTADILPGYQPGEAEAQTIAQICLQLDGIPLAIELAAARMNLLSAREIAARLDSRFSLLTAGHRTALPRHQTLQAAIEWSYDLVSESEKLLFRRLTVFAGSFTLEAAEAVCTGEGIQHEEVLTLLGRLVDKSLLNVSSNLQDAELATRYRFLDTIYRFGRLKLEEAGEIHMMRNRHAAYYVHLAETAEPELLLSKQRYWYRFLQAEQGNLRAVVEWSLDSEQAEFSLRLMGALLWFWWSHGSIHEGLELVLKSLALPAAQLEIHRVKALNSATYLHWVMGENSLAKQKNEEALSILRKLDDDASLAWALQFLGLVLTSEGKYELADEAMQEGIAIARKMGDLTLSSFSLAFLGDISLQQGDHRKAISVYEESATLLSSLGNKLFEAYTQRRLGYLALEQNKVQIARDYFRKSLVNNQEGGDRRAVAACLTGFAILALHLDKPVIAARILGAIEHQLETLSTNLLYLDQAELECVRGTLKADLDQNTFAAAFNEGWQMSEKQVMELVDQIY